MTVLERRHLIVVDDEADIRNMVAEYLGKDGCVVTCCANARELDAILMDARPDVILLDVNLPGEDGISIARRLRASGTTPIVMLTSLNDVVDRIIGLEVGADDYLAKPFDLRELKARVRAILRRSEGTNSPAKAPHGPVHSGTRINFGRVALDLDEHCLVCPEGAKTKLTASEYELLAAFGRNPHRVLSRERLLDGATGRSSEAFDRAIDIRITRIAAADRELSSQFALPTSDVLSAFGCGLMGSNHLLMEKPFRSADIASAVAALLPSVETTETIERPARNHLEMSRGYSSTIPAAAQLGNSKQEKRHVQKQPRKAPSRHSSQPFPPWHRRNGQGGHGTHHAHRLLRVCYNSVQYSRLQQGRL